MKIISNFAIFLFLVIGIGCGSGSQQSSDEGNVEELIEEKVDSVSGDVINEIEQASENIKQQATETEEKVNKLLEDI